MTSEKRRRPMLVATKEALADYIRGMAVTDAAKKHGVTPSAVSAARKRWQEDHPDSVASDAEQAFRLQHDICRLIDRQGELTAELEEVTAQLHQMTAEMKSLCVRLRTKVREETAAKMLREWP